MPEHPVDRRSLSNMGRMLLLCSALLCLVIGTTSKLQYGITVPASLISEDLVKACVNLYNSNERLAVTLILEHNGRNTSIIAEDTESSNYHQCGEFQVPKITKAVPVAIIFQATGAKTDLRERKSLVIDIASITCMYQMDKPTYKPGQTVRWRILCLDSQLKPVNQEFTVMYLKDPSRTKITQWLQPESKHGVVSGQFHLVPDAALGSHVITAERKSGYPVSQYFSVEEYVMPRYSLTMDVPQTVSVTEESLQVKVSAIYSYGEPVPGSVTVRYCIQQQYYGRRQNCFKDKGDPCSTMVGELSADGTYVGVIDLYSMSRRSGVRSLNLDVTVTEAGTGIQTTESRYIWLTFQPASLNFDYDHMIQYYRKGIHYPVVATLKNERGEPMPNQEINIQIDNGETAKALTDSDGRISYPVDTSNMINPNLTITVSYTNPDQCYYAEWSNKDYPSSEYTADRFYSHSSSFVQIKRSKGELICDQDHRIDVDYIINSGDEIKAVTFYYLVMSKSAIVHSGQKDVDLGGTKNGSFYVDLPVSYSMAPSANFIIYSNVQDEIIADTISLSVEKCFKNQVSMTFSEEKVKPGSPIEAQLSAAPNSFCALSVIDSNLLLLNPYDQFSADRVYNSRRSYYYGYNVAGFDVEDPAPPCEDPDKLVFCNGRYYLPVSSPSEGDSYSIFKSIGLIMGTGAKIRKPEVCDRNPPPQNIIPLGGKPGIGGGGYGGPVAKLASLEMDSAPRGGGGQVETVRTNFAETFMWVMVPLDKEGHGTVSDTLPDSITKWQGTAFCTSEDKGFGMTKTPANVTTVLPFFMDMPVQYSCVRGEVVALKGVVRNNLGNYVKATANLQPSPDYDASLTDGQQYVCIPPGGHAAFTWQVTPTTIGEISFTATAETTFIGESCDGPNDPSRSHKDTVVPTMRVEPEGIFQERTTSNLIYVQGKTVQLPISVTLPDNVVPDSAKSFATVVGDIIGLSMQNIDDLVQKPQGCGDQNLGRLWVIPHVIDYLNKTDQLNDEVLQKAKSYMVEGYQRQLSYISGGAYKLFPTSTEVNSVLTAETFGCFEAIKKYVYVDEDRQQQTLIWMENAQKLENGCFKAEGKPVTNQEGNIDVQYTATVALALLEAEYSLGHTLLNGAMECLRTASKSEQSLYEEVLMLTVFTRAKDEEYRKPLLEKLMKKAISRDGTIFWQREDMPAMPKVPFFWPQFPSTEVFMTASMLLNLAKSPSVTPEDLSTIAQIAVWVVRQENSNGGFSSTRDTRIAIQALTAVAEHFYVPNAQQTVTIRRNDAEVATIDLNQNNKLVVHRQALPEASGDYLMDVSGSGWSLVQFTTQYYIPVPKENSAYSFSISPSAKCMNGVAHKITLNCSLSYHGSHNESGMTILKMRMLSGYSPDYFSMSKLKNDKIISKFEETQKGDVIFYVDKTTSEPVEFSFDATMGRTVFNLQSASGLTYAYYEDSENGYAAYSHPCAAVKEDGGRTEESSPAVGPKDPPSKSSRKFGFVWMKKNGWKQTSKKKA